MTRQRLVFLLHRLPHLSREEFQHYWWTVHAPLVAARAECVGIRRYQQVHTVRAARNGQPPEYDGIAELWFDGPEPAGSPDERIQAGADLLADERNFIDLARSPIWMAEERPVLAGPQEGLRLTAVLTRRDGWSRDEFDRYWADRHARLAMDNNDVLGFTHYVQLRTPDDAEAFRLRAPRGAPPPPDGVSEVWLRDVTPGEARTAEGRSAIYADEDVFMDRAARTLFLSEVRVVLDR